MNYDKKALERIIALVGLYLKSGKVEEALLLLDRVKSKFLESGAESNWAFWHVQALIAHGEAERALEAAREEKDPHISRIIRTMALREIARRSDEWPPYAAHLETCFEETHDGDVLFELCQLKTHIKEWEYVAKRAEILIQLVATAEALRLAAYAAWNAGHPQKCLRLLNENYHFFPSQLLPADLSRLRVLCQARLGLLSQAVADAEALVRQDDTTENVLTLMDVQLLKGDLKGLAITARRLVLREDIKPISLLRAARLTSFEEPELAKEFWHRAREDALNDPALLNEALTLGFRLGLDIEMTPLIHRMQEFATHGRGAFQIVRLEEFPPMMRNRAEHITFVNQSYERGQIPIHFLAEELDMPLARVFHDLPERNRNAPDPVFQPIIWTRHGGRPLQQQLANASNSWRLHLDLTAVLLAADLGILEKVEQSFSPLLIAPQVPAALVRQRDMLASSQPTRLASYCHLLQFLEDGKLQPTPQITDTSAEPTALLEKMGAEWVTLIEKARTEGGFIVDYLPLTSNDLKAEPISLPEQYRELVVNCRALIEGLWHNGYFSESRYQQGLQELGSEGIAEVPSQVPAAGSRVFLVGNIAGVLADAKLLASVCRHFQVFVDDRFVDEARQAVQEDKRRNELTTWLGRLIDRVRAGLDAGIYESIILPDARPTPELEEKEARNLDVLSLLTFLHYPPSEGDVIWVDDRWVNGHAHRDGVPIIGINEVLQALLHRDSIQESAYYEILLKLRASNFRYIPITKDEIHCHLRQAQLVDGAVVETEELSILRRYIAACLLDSARLQRPPMPQGADNPYGEIAFVIGTVRAVSDAIIACWLDEQCGDDVAQARADWILNNLYTGWFGVRHLRDDPDPDSDGMDLIGRELGGALAQGFALRGETPNKKSEEDSTRRKFFDWLESRVISKRFKADPEAVVAVVDNLKNLLTEATDRHYDEQRRGIVARLLLQRYFFDLPESIQDAIQLDAEMMARLGVTTFKSVTIGPLCFEQGEFAKVAVEAANGRFGLIIAREPKAEFTLTSSFDNSAGRRLIEIKDQQGVVVATFRDPLIDLLLDNPKAREECLRAQRLWFDCGTDEFEKAVADIVSMEGSQDRVDKGLGWRKASAAVFYANLERRLIDSGQFSQDELLPPSAEGLLRHFRIDISVDGKSDFHASWQKAAIALLAEEGFESAVEHMGCLPVKLPSVLFEKFDGLSDEERRDLLRRLSARWASPVCRLHLIDLALHEVQTNVDFQDSSRSTLVELFDEMNGALHYRLFDALLNFVNDEFGYWADAACWPGPIRLAMVWAHASKLHNLFAVSQIASIELAEWLEKARRRISAEILGRELTSWNDVLHPRRQNRTDFLVHAVASIVSGHDPEIIEQLGVKDLLLATGFTGDDGNRSPRLPLLRDSTLASNALDSFLGGDRSAVLAPCIGNELSTMLASSSLKSMVKEAIQNLKRDPCQQSEWAKIAAIVGNLPMYGDLAAESKGLLEQINFRSLDAADPLGARLALRVASDQVVHLENESIRSRCQGGLHEITRSQASRNGRPTDNAESGLFLDYAIELSIRSGDPRATSKAFTKLLQDHEAIARDVRCMATPCNDF